MFKKYITALVASDHPSTPVVTKDVTTVASTVVKQPESVLTIGTTGPTYRTETMNYTGTYEENSHLRDEVTLRDKHVSKEDRLHNRHKRKLEKWRAKLERKVNRHIQQEQRMAYKHIRKEEQLQVSHVPVGLANRLNIWETKNIDHERVIVK